MIIRTLNETDNQISQTKREGPLETIDGSTKAASMLRVRKFLWWLHIYFLINITMEKDIFHIELIKRPSTSCNQSNKCSNISHLQNWGKGLFLVYAILLSK